MFKSLKISLGGANPEWPGTSELNSGTDRQSSNIRGIKKLEQLTYIILIFFSKFYFQKIKFPLGNTYHREWALVLLCTILFCFLSKNIKKF